MKYSVSIYSFFSAIQAGELTPLQCVSVAKDLGFDAIEAVDFVNFSGTQEEKKAQALELKEAADKCGLAISSLAVGADFLNGSDGNMARAGNPAGQGLGGHCRVAGELLGCVMTSPKGIPEIPVVIRAMKQLDPHPGGSGAGGGGLRCLQGSEHHDGKPRFLLSGFPAGGKALHGSEPPEFQPVV